MQPGISYENGHWHRNLNDTQWINDKFLPMAVYDDVTVTELNEVDFEGDMSLEDKPRDPEDYQIALDIMGP
jgi:hypothetical protein